MNQFLFYVETENGFSHIGTILSTSGESARKTIEGFFHDAGRSIKRIEISGIMSRTFQCETLGTNYGIVRLAP